MSKPLASPAPVHHVVIAGKACEPDPAGDVPIIADFAHWGRIAERCWEVYADGPGAATSGPGESALRKPGSRGMRLLDSRTGLPAKPVVAKRERGRRVRQRGLNCRRGVSKR